MPRALLLSAAILASLLLAVPAQAASPDVTISQVYGGGGNSGATLTRDYIELYNRSAAAVPLDGWSVQYASAAGSTWQVTPLTGSIAPGGHYLIAEAAGAGGTEPLPTPDATGSIAMSATSGKVALVTSAAPLACGTDCDASARDFIGYGTANDFETAAAPSLSNATAAKRAGDGATDTDNNAADFTAGAPDPRNSGGGPGGPEVESSDPADDASDVPLDKTISVTFTEPVADPEFALECDDVPQAVTVEGSGDAYTVDPAADLPSGASCTLRVSIPGGPFTNIDFTTVGVEGLRIHDIQGAAHLSPHAGHAGLRRARRDHRAARQRHLRPGSRARRRRAHVGGHLRLHRRSAGGRPGAG